MRNVKRLALLFSFVFVLPLLALAADELLISAKQQLDHWARVGRSVSMHQTAARRRVEAALAVPKKTVTTSMQLLDTAKQANFASGSDELTSAAMASLDGFAASLREAHLQRLLVTAHTDSQRLVREAKKRFATNQQLSEARAARVAQYLQTALNLPEGTCSPEIIPPSFANHLKS